MNFSYILTCLKSVCNNTIIIISWALLLSTSAFGTKWTLRNEFYPRGSVSAASSTRILLPICPTYQPIPASSLYAHQDKLHGCMCDEHCWYQRAQVGPQ